MSALFIWDQYSFCILQITCSGCQNSLFLRWINWHNIRSYLFYLSDVPVDTFHTNNLSWTILITGCPVRMGADASPLLMLQAFHRDSAAEQQQQLRCYSGYLSSEDGRGGYRGASSSTSISLQGLAAGGPDISEWWQVTWKDKACLCTAVYEGLPGEFLLGFMCVGKCLFYVQNKTWSPVSTHYMNILHMFKVAFGVVVYAALSTFPQAASSPSPAVIVFLQFPKCCDAEMGIVV